MTYITFTSSHLAERTGRRSLAGTIVHAYWWAQSVARAYARTNDVVRSVSETAKII